MVYVARRLQLGAAFLVPLMPFLALLVGPAWEGWVVHRRRGNVGRMAVVLLVVLSVGVQWLGMLAPFHLVQDWLADKVAPLFAPETFVNPAYSPLWLQWRFITPGNIDLTWWRTQSWPGTIDWLGLAMPLSGVGVGILILVRQLRSDDGDEGKNSTHEWLYGAALCIIALAILTHVNANLSDPEIRRVAERIARLEQPGDAILNLLPAQSQEFANVYHGRLPAYGLLPQETLDAPSAVWLTRLQHHYSRLWLLPDNTLPEKSGWERTLRMDDFLLTDTHVSDADGQRLALFALAGAQPMQETGLGTVFGDPALTDTRVTEQNGWIQLEGYALTPDARPGGALLLALRWKSLHVVNYNYQVFVHLLNANNEKLAQRDGQPVQWMRPTSTWHTGEEIIDRYGLLLPRDLPAGSYNVAVGLYDPVTGQRLPVSAGPRDYAIELGPIQVTRGD